MKKEIIIEGMSCGHCSSRVEKALGEIMGVTVQSVSSADNNAVVVVDNVEDRLLIEAIDDAGYDVVEIKEV
jgi:Cu+-exporting ATPase